MDTNGNATPTGTSTDKAQANEAGKRTRKANERKTATTKARKDAAPEVERAYLIALLGADGEATWVTATAAGPKRAAKAARKAGAKGRILGCVEAVLKGQRIG